MRTTAEYMQTVKLTAAGTAAIPIPTNGAVLGVYSTSAVTLEWVFNGEKAKITPTAATVWEPRVPFAPRPTSVLEITSTAAADVLIRMV